MSTPKRIYSVFVSLVAIWCAGILLAPVLQSAGIGVSAGLYSIYSPICHQIDQRSLHLAGEKLGVCARCSSIYGGFLLVLFIYPFVHNLRSPSVPGPLWFSLAVIPMIVDALLSVTGLHPSTIATRAVTGFIFGAVLPFYIVPPLLEGVAQVYDRLTSRGGLIYARKAEQV